jgi:Glycoside Hydrolase Family 113
MRTATALACALLVLGSACSRAAENATGPREPNQIQDGITFNNGWRSEAFHGPDAVEAMTNLADTGAGWVAIVIDWFQGRIAATDIRPLKNMTPPDEDVVAMIRLAHELGLKVMLKPHVDLVRKWWNKWKIGTTWGDDPAARDAWFASYEAYVFHYAELAEAEGVEQFAVGTELFSTSPQEERWREVVSGVRERFSGTLTYAALYTGEESSIAWWDAVDLIGVDAYWPLTDGNEPTLAELEDAWTPILQRMADLSARWGDKPILFTEIGYVSLDGANANPGDPFPAGRPLDLQEQADCYLAAFESAWDEPWFAGMYWWDWSADPEAGGSRDGGFTPFGKPAEGVLRSWY